MSRFCIRYREGILHLLEGAGILHFLETSHSNGLHSYGGSFTCLFTRVAEHSGVSF